MPLDPALREHATALVAVRLDEAVAHAVAPGAGEVGHLGAQRVQVGREHLALGDVNREVHACVAVGQHLVRLVHRSSVTRREQRAQAFEHPRVVAGARHRDDERMALPVGGAPCHEPGPAGPRAQQLHHRSSEILDGRCEQLVLGERLEQRHEGLVVVRALDEVFRGEDLAQLAMQQRYLARRLCVGLRGEEADHAGLAGRAPLRVDDPHADGVHPHPPVDRRHPDGLGYEQQVVPRNRPGMRRARGVREQPEAGALDQRHRAVGARILAGAEEDEVVAGQPVQELHRLVDLVLGVTRRRRPGDMRHPPHGRGHGAVVADHAAHVGEDPTHAVLEVGQLLGGEAPVELEVHDRLGRRRLRRAQHLRDVSVRGALRADDRVHDADDADAPRLDLGRDRVDEEREIVRVGLQDGAGRVIAVLGDGRVQRAHCGRRAAAGGRELERAQDLVEQLLGVDLTGALGRQAVQIGPRELADRRRPLRAQARLDELQQLVRRRPALVARALLSDGAHPPPSSRARERASKYAAMRSAAARARGAGRGSPGAGGRRTSQGAHAPAAALRPPPAAPP